jgi:DNA-directed RNA polymerase specialized sigma24 family protein
VNDRLNQEDGMSSDDLRSELEALVRRCAQGDREAWDEVVPRFRDALTRSLEHWPASRSLGEDLRCLAEDITQEVFSRLWKRKARRNAFPTQAGQVLALLIVMGHQRIMQRLQSHQRHGHPVAVGQELGIADERLDAQALELLLAEFAELLPPREKDYWEHHLLKAPTEQDARRFPKKTRWRLRHRLKRRWLAFRRGSGPAQSFWESFFRRGKEWGLGGIFISRGNSR